MNLTKLAFEYRRTVLMIVTILLINGVFAYFTLPTKEDPTITIREATVTTQFPGMSPERIELLITKTLEEEIRKIPEVEKLRSTSSTGLSVIHVEIHDRYFNLSSIWQNLRNKVSSAQTSLPEGTYTSVVNDEVGDVSVITLALTADGFEHGEMFDVAKHIRDNLYSVSGTKKIDLYGVQEERIFIEVSNARLAQLGIAPQSLVSELQSQNIISSGGEVDTGKKSFIIEPSGNFDSLDELADTYIKLAGVEEYVALKDIVTISRGYIDPPDKPAYFNGQQAIMFAIAMLPEYNLLEYAPRLMDKANEIQGTLPIGYQIDVATYQPEQVQKTVDGVSINVLQTLAIVLVIVILFLGMRTGLVVGTIVPFVMLTTLSIMQFSGIDLERMSLATLIISLGLLVDNGIVIAEDFKSRLEQGEERFKAMVQGGKELALPLLSSSATTVLFFLPLMLAEHVAGEFTRSVSLVILITLLASWLLALCVTPIFCYYFIKLPKDHDVNHSNDSKAYQKYERFLATLLANKIMFFISIILIFVLAIYGMGLTAKQFFPDSDRTQILVYVDLPNGTSARETNRQMKDIIHTLNDSERFPYIQSHLAYVGFGGPRFVLSLSPEDPADNKGFMVLNIEPDSNADEIVVSLDEALEAQFPNISARVTKMFLGPSDSSTIKIQVKGPDKDVIYAKAQEVMDLLYATPNTKDIRSDWENRITKVVVKVDQQRARRSGVTSSDIANSLQSYFSGASVTEFREGDDIIPVKLRANETERSNLDRLRSLTVYSESTGKAVPLFQVAYLIPENQYSKIQREDMTRTVSIEAKNSRMAAEDLKRIVDEQIQQLAQDLPTNHSIEYDGVIIESVAAQKALSASMPFVLGVIFILLVAQFNSYRRAFVIVCTMPLSIVGAVIGLLVMNAPFGFMVTLGIYSLAGIIINNAIVLIDRIDIERQGGASDYQAILSASKSRLRPIIMTTITTVMGLLPLIIGHDPLFYGMATVIAFGLAVGTVLTLGAVPVLYATFFKVHIPKNS
ncbi:efflux RND transporter permease subunit [Paraglaciecola sp. 2405UD69-4]|uniref:efflux RND transporter permease subunit n=1 Tax=Paraglaciecola sp. 2405UD69-4 TaxID=3391836 RepID=UPI0039C97856